MHGYCRVAIDSRVPALDRPFDYAIPDRMIGKVHPGCVVRVVLHGRNIRAFVTELLTVAAVPSARPLRSLVSPEPVFTPAEIELARWIAQRYVVPLGHVFHDAVPGRFSAPGSKGPDSPLPTQTAAPAWLRGDLEKVVKERGAVLVFPPTLRDEIDLAVHVSGVAASHGGRTLVVCPRVEMVEAVAARMPGALVLHGSDRPSERAAAWAAARDCRAHVVVGGRSAILVPLPDMAAVCVLSAHDRSLKAERAPRMHALVVAEQRARVAGAAFIASSPAPPVELAADDGIVWMGSAHQRVRIEIARPRSGPVTPRLVDVTRWAVERGTDALVFVGMRGTTLRLRCHDCGWCPTCARCGSGLARGDAGRLVCRVCGSEAGVPATCASCGGALVERGWGHERVARTLEDAGVGAPVVRIVRGVVPDSRPHPAVLVGTLAAVHSIDDAGSVSVADLDSLLARPDFRAAERALQTLHELAGSLRPGGRFLVQTREPDHHAVQAFTRQSYRYFLDRELAFRKDTGYPPFGVVVRVVTSGAEDIDALRAVTRPAGAQVIGPVPARGGASALIRAPALEPLLEPLRRFAADHTRTRIDVDPVDVI